MPYEDVNPDHFRQRNYNFRNIHNIEKIDTFPKLPRNGTCM